MLGNLIVVRFADGTVQKGTSFDVDPQRPLCHLREGNTMREVSLGKLKALFFVKTLDGRPEYHEVKSPLPGDPRLIGARLVRIRFQDGEELVGLMNRFPPIAPFFFVLPVDPASNNIRILVNRSEVKEVAELSPAELAAREDPGAEPR
ncbi:MAG TPA: hypothetical protein VGP61_08485 [Gemmatimonadales bacterium]|jgi:hypothetical protein|nr:hypothetical protein [Gemmatimonadales bacterium]